MADTTLVTLDEVKSWLKISWTYEDSDLQILLDASIAYLNNVTSIFYDNTNPLAKLYVRVLCMDWYENKGLMQEVRLSDKVRYTLQSILLQLQYSC
jgi:hypothetical protein